MAWAGLSRIAANAGLNVSELNAEITVDTETVTANCLKNEPVIPEMNVQGMNTAVSTRATAITGPDTSRMAWMAASRGIIPSSIWCSTASTTTIASSTTIPIASTRPNSVRLLMLKPIASITPNVPMIATGTATSGISAERQLCRNTSTTIATSSTASNSVCFTSSIDSLMKGVVSKRMS